jgi:hypothetical protein
VRRPPKRRERRCDDRNFPVPHSAVCGRSTDGGVSGGQLRCRRIRRFGQARIRWFEPENPLVGARNPQAGAGSPLVGAGNPLVGASSPLGALGVGAGAVPADDLDTGMISEPVGEGVGFPIFEQVQRGSVAGCAAHTAGSGL